MPTGSQRSGEGDLARHWAAAGEVLTTAGIDRGSDHPWLISKTPGSARIFHPLTAMGAGHEAPRVTHGALIPEHDRDFHHTGLAPRQQVLADRHGMY